MCIYYVINYAPRYITNVTIVYVEHLSRHVFYGSWLCFVTCVPNIPTTILPTELQLRNIGMCVYLLDYKL